MKEKKLIIGVTAIVAIVVIIGIVIAVGSNKSEKETTTVPGQTTTNFWDDVDVFEGDGQTEQVTVEGNLSDSSIEMQTDENGGDVVIIDMGDGETTKAGENVEKTTKSTENSQETTTKKSTSNKDNNNTGNGNSDSNSNSNGGNSDSNNGSSNGETASEEYPGQNDGWSPIVSPDDLEGN